jgi:hypothetical protein
MQQPRTLSQELEMGSEGPHLLHYLLLEPLLLLLLASHHYFQTRRAAHVGQSQRGRPGS